MNRAAVIVLVLATLCVSIYGDDSGEHIRAKRQVTRPPKTTKSTTTKTPVCNRQNFDTLKTCCSSGVGAFFTQDEIKTCANGKADPKLAKYASFQLNTLYDNSNKIELNAKALRAMGNVPCIIECLFIKKGLLDANNKTIWNNTIAHFAKAASPNWLAAGAPPAFNSSTNASSLIEEVINQCAPLIDAFTPSNITIVDNKKNSQTCLTQPGLLLQCIRKTVANSCPPKLKSSTPNCQKSLNILKVCGYFNTGVTYNA